MRSRDPRDFLAIRTSGTLVCYIDRLEITLAYLKREINYTPSAAKMINLIDRRCARDRLKLNAIFLADPGKVMVTQRSGINFVLFK